MKAHRCAAGQRGELNQAIGRSQDGRTTKILALTDRFCRIVLDDKGYDSDAIRRQIKAIGAAPNILPKVNRR